MTRGVEAGDWSGEGPRQRDVSVERDPPSLVDSREPVSKLLSENGLTGPEVASQ